jgi:hypothetical protein
MFPAIKAIAAEFTERQRGLSSQILYAKAVHKAINCLLMPILYRASLKSVLYSISQLAVKKFL